MACSTYFRGFRMLIGNKDLWGQFSQVHYYSLGWSCLPNFTEISQAISPPGSDKRFCRKKHRYIGTEWRRVMAASECSASNKYSYYICWFHKLRDWSSMRSKAKASGWIPSTVTTTDWVPSLKRTSCPKHLHYNARHIFHGRVCYRMLSLCCACTRRLGIILIC